MGGTDRSVVVFGALAPPLSLPSAQGPIVDLVRSAANRTSSSGSARGSAVPSAVRRGWGLDVRPMPLTSYAARMLSALWAPKNPPMTPAQVTVGARSPASGPLRVSSMT